MHSCFNGGNIINGMINKLLEKIEGKWIFLIMVVALYVITTCFNPRIIVEILIQFKVLFVEVVPIFILVFVFMFLSNYFLNPKKIQKYVGKDVGVKGWTLSVVAGILSSGPIYMWYPLLSDLKDKGMKDDFIVVFLYNRAVKIPMIPMLIFYFGISFTILLSVYMITFSVINGIIVGKLLKFNN